MADMSCPRCGEHLGESKLNEVEIRICAGCMGLLVEQRRLLPLLDAMALELLMEVDLDTEVEMIEDRGPVGACPSCGSAMDCDGYMGSKEVSIDRCNSCWRIWIDPMELGAMSLMYARAEKKLEYTEKKLAEAREKIQLSGVASPGYSGHTGGMHTAAERQRFDQAKARLYRDLNMSKGQARVIRVLTQVLPYL